MFSVDLVIVRGPSVGPPVPGDPAESHQDALPTVLAAAEVELGAGVEFLQPEEHQNSDQKYFTGQRPTSRAGNR